MNDALGTIRIREEPTAKSIYVKIGENHWSVAYTGLWEAIVGTCSDKVATLWPVVYTPDYVVG